MSVMITEHTRRKPDGATCHLCALPITTGERYLQLVAVREDWADRNFLIRLAHDCCAHGREEWEPTEVRAHRAAAKVAEAEHFRDLWNRLHPIGTWVRYWPMAKEGEGRQGVTRSRAWLIGGHASVLVSTYPGGIALTHVEVV